VVVVADQPALDAVAAGLKRAQRASREALAATRDLQRLVGDEFVGQFHLPAAPTDAALGELAEFLRLAVADSPGRDLSIIVVAAEPQGG
jgi:hypothetical protein